MEIRQLTEQDRERAHYIVSQAFMSGSRRPLPDMSSWPAFTSYGVWDEGGLQAEATVLRYEVFMGDRALMPMGGVAAVACLPASRGKGYAGALMRRALEHMRESGLPISSLFPFSFDFYARLGYAWTGATRSHTIPLSVLRPCPETARVRAVEPGEHAKIREVYRRFAQRHRGMLDRSDSAWTAVLGDSDEHHSYVHLYEGDGGPEGYLHYRGGGDEVRVSGFVALTPAAYRGLLGLLARLAMQVRKVVLRAPGSETLWMYRAHWDITTESWPTCMSRIVDVPAALAAWRPNESARGRVTLAVRDDTCPWNDGAWQLEFADGHAEVTPARGEPQLRMEIGALSQAYFGTPTLDEIRHAGGIAVADETAYAALNAFLSGPPMWLADHF